MVSTTERFTDNSKMSPGPSVTIINPSARKSLCLFTKVLYVKNKTAVFRVGAAESNRKSIIVGSILCSSIIKRIGHTKPLNELRNLFIIEF